MKSPHQQVLGKDEAAMEIPPDPTPDMLSLPRFDDDAIDMRELLRRLAEQVVDVAMDAEADQPCGAEPNKSICERRFWGRPYLGLKVPGRTS